MSDLVRRDPFLNLFAWPRWIDDYDVTAHQRGLKIHETDKDIIIEAVVAGIDAGDVDVDIEDGVLTIKAEKKEEEKDKGVYKTSSYQYYYTCALSGGQWDKTSAEIKNGILKVIIPKAEAAKKRKVSVTLKK